MPESDDSILRWAEAIVDGAPLDWSEASGEGGDQRLERLKTLAAIARVCRMPPAAPRAPGDVLFRWCHLEIHERIGKGGYGEVYRGWDPKLEREVAVKFLRPEAPSAETHALQEGRRLARVRHPGVVMVFGAEERDGRVGIWMEYVRGETLEDRLQEHGPFSSHEALLIGIDLCRALAAVHHAGLVHRDVKTRNVVREHTGRIVLMDFGAGAESRSDGGESQEMAGTPIYLAPEVLRGEPATPQSDLYGLGVLLYRLVTRHYPTAGATIEALRAAHQRQESRSLREARPGLPAPFRRVVERALSPDPARRFASAEQMEHALAAALDAPRRMARRRAGIAVAAAAALAALGVSIAAQHTRPTAPGSFSNRPLVAVADVAGDVGDQELGALSGMLAMSLDQSRDLLVLTRSQMSDVLAASGKSPDARIDAALGLDLCRRQRATALLVPTISRDGDRYRIALEALEPRRGRRLFAASAEAAGKGGFSGAIDSLAQRVRDGLVRNPEAAPGGIRPVAQITTTSLSAFHHFDRAEHLIGRLEMAAARVELERAVELDSSFALALARLAYVCWWTNDTDCERDRLAQAFAMIDRVPERHRFHLRAQGAMAERQGLEVSRSILLEMERFYPNDKEMLYDIGDYSSHLNEFPQAIQYLERVIGADPKFVRAIQHVARVYRDMGRRGPALEWARRYAAADSAWDAYVLLGNALVASGNVESGVAMLARGRAVAPEHGGDNTMFIARTRLFEGRTAEGRREYEALIRAAASPAQRRGAIHERARGRIHQGLAREALADFEQVATLARADRDPIGEAMARIDAALLQRVAWDDSVGALRQIARCADPEANITYQDTYFHYWPFWGGLFKLHLLNGDLDAADALARRKFVADKWYGPYVEAYRQAARGNCAQALAAASRVLEWGPAEENVTLLYFLARCQLQHDEPEEAVESLLALQALYSHQLIGTPFYGRSLKLLGEAYERSGDNERAAQAYSRLLELWREGDRDLPDRLEAQRRLARLRPGFASLGN